MITRAQIVTEARTWIGTPYHHQGHLRAVGADCHGLLRGVGLALGLLNMGLRDLPEVRRFHHYGREPSGFFLDAMRVFHDEIPVGEIKPGNIVALRIAQQIRHCGILGDHPSGALTLIHSYQTKVMEHRLDARWAKRIVAAFAFRGAEQ